MTPKDHARPACPINSFGPREAILAIGICALFLLTSLAPLIQYAIADPTETINSGGNREIHWTYDDPANYTMTSAVVSGGHATLRWNNETITENTQAAYDQAAVKQNINLSAFPGSVVLGYSRPVVSSYFVEPAPTVSNDTYISQETPGANYATANILDFNSQVNKQKRPMLYFDLSAIPANSTIINATLSFWVKGGQNSALDFTIHALNVSYDVSSADWLHYASGALWTVAGGDFSAYSYCQGQMTNTVGWQSYEIGALIEGWVQGSIQNHGLIFVYASTGTSTDKQVVSANDAGHPTQWPKLRVNYTLITGTGQLLSNAIGPGTNSSFTSVSWSGSMRSLATDEFNSSSLNPRWSWMRDPKTLGGTWDVSTTRPGWLRIVGSPNTYSNTAVLKSNFIYQNVSGDFSSTVCMEDQFTSNSMGGGMVLMYDQHNWLSIVKYGTAANAKLWVSAFQDDAGISGPQVTWSGLSIAYFRIDKTSAGAQVNYSADGIAWNPMFTYTPVHVYSSRAIIGLEVYSSTSANVVASFDYFRINPFIDRTSLQVETRLGNSTSLSDPSWTSWSAPLAMGETPLSGTARYIQYAVTLASPESWCSPVFSGIAIHYSRYSTNGVVSTLDVTVPYLKRWVSIWTFEDLNGQTVAYDYSVDHGVHWTDLINGYPNSVSSTSPSMIIRGFMHTDDTLTTPSLNLINATYAVSPAGFYVSVPSRVLAGEEFMITVTAKDEFNRTIPWTGDVTLHAMDSTGTANASSELNITTMSISATGWSVLWERYPVAETIRIMARSGTCSGLGNPIQFTPGPVASISISPSVSSMNENSSRIFTATARDSLGNVNSTAALVWSVDSALGVINASSGPSVRLTVGPPYVNGNLTVTSGGVTRSLTISVTPQEFPPVILPIPRQVRDEDSGIWTLDLTPYISDPDDGLSSLRYRVSNQTIITVQAGPGTFNLTFDTLPNLNGVDYLKLVVTDQSGLSAWATIVVEIRPVNDAPSIDQIDPLVVHFDVPYTYFMRHYVHDIDTPLDQLVLTVDQASAPFVYVDRMTLTILYPERFNGTTQLVRVTVSDGQLTASTTIQITISSDQVPVLTNPLPDVTLDQGSSLINAFDLDQYFRDPDLDVLYYAFGNSHVTITIQLNHTVDFRAPRDWSGIEYVTFRAIDSKGARVEYTIMVTVIPVNQPPEISGVPDLVVHYDVPYDFDLMPYIRDLDGDREVRTVTTDDSHIAINGTVMTLLYPQSMDGSLVRVTITVHDSGLSASCEIIVTVSSDSPPVLAHQMPDHSFFEDSPIDYPIGTSLTDYFADPEGEPLQFTAFMSTPNITVQVEVDEGSLVVEFVTDQNYNGQSNLTIRAVETVSKALVETTVRVTIIPVPDPPQITLPSRFNVTEGVQTFLDMSRMVTDPDSGLSQMTFVVSGPGVDQGMIKVQNTILVFVFPDDFLLPGENSREFTINVTVYDETGLSSSDSIIVRVVKPMSVSSSPLNPWMVAGMIGLAAAALVGIGLALYRRKKPFVIRDMMLIHNDGFLISRFASPHTGEIDEDVLSGMLTAVLNFVEDSMSSTMDQLKTFGFKEYQVLVTRGTKTFVAVVYEGDAPTDIDKPLNEFIAKIEKVYRKKIAEWTGDIETDFAGASVLLEAFVKEHDEGTGKKSLAGLWTHKQKSTGPD